VLERERERNQLRYRQSERWTRKTHSGVRNGPLLERSVDGETGKRSLAARGLKKNEGRQDRVEVSSSFFEIEMEELKRSKAHFESLSTLLTVEARISEPLDTDGVSDLEGGRLSSSLERRTDVGDVSRSLVSSDERKLLKGK